MTLWPRLPLRFIDLLHLRPVHLLDLYIYVSETTSRSYDPTVSPHLDCSVGATPLGSPSLLPHCDDTTPLTPYTTLHWHLTSVFAHFQALDHLDCHARLLYHYRTDTTPMIWSTVSYSPRPSASRGDHPTAA
jgi:hypothetical protein